MSGAEAFATTSDGLEICYQTFGDPGGTPLLLCMGLGGPMNWWDAEFCGLLAERGFHVVRYDNRDTGKSSRAEGQVSKSDLVGAFTLGTLGLLRQPPYSLSDLANDATAVMDALGWPAAHVVGLSLGGMIMQTLAIEHPQRVLSMVSMMSTLGRRSVGYQHPMLATRLLSARRPGLEGYIADSSSAWRRISSPAYPPTDASLRKRAVETFNRGVSASGIKRQMMAVLTQPDRTKALAELDIPVAVIHGDSDRLVHVSGGRATSQAIPGSEFVLVKGMGHDLPRVLWQTFADVIERTTARAVTTA